MKIESTKNTPEITWEPSQGIFTVVGKSFPENSKKFYTPIYDWIDQQSFPAQFRIKIHLDYVSSSSIIGLYQLIKKFDALLSKGISIEIDWLYDEDDDDMFRVGEDYQKLTSIKINFFEVKEED